MSSPYHGSRADGDLLFQLRCFFFLFSIMVFMPICKLKILTEGITSMKPWQQIHNERLNSLELFSLEKRQLRHLARLKNIVWSRHIGINSFFLEGRKNEGTSQVQARQKEMALHTERWKHEELLGKGQHGCKNFEKRLDKQLKNICWKLVNKQTRGGSWNTFTEQRMGDC